MMGVSTKQLKQVMLWATTRGSRGRASIRRRPTPRQFSSFSI